MARKDSRESPQISGTKPALWPFTLAVIAVYCLVAVAAFLPHAQLWGVNHLAFYSLPTRLAALGLMGITFIPPVARRLYSTLLRLSHILKHGGSRVDVILTLIAALSFLVFAQFKTSTNLLGDGQLIVQSFDAAWDGNDNVIMRSVKAIVTEERIAPGATLLYYGAAKVASGVFDKGPVWGIRFVNYFLGAFFVFIVLWLVRKGPFSPEIRLWLLVLALFSATVQLFFGYVENYTPVVFIGYMYVMAGIMAVRNRARLPVVIVLFAAAFYSHIQAVLLVPSLVFILLWRVAVKKRTKRATVEKYAFPVITAVVLILAFVAGFTSISQYYLPLHGNEQTYSLFSFVHVADFFNEILILLPMAPLLVVMALASRRFTTLQSTTHSPKDGDGAAGWMTTRAEWHFVYLLLIPCLVYLLLFKPEIGMARDWDLFTITSLGLVPLALLVLNRFYRAVKIPSDAAAVFTGPALAICVVLFVSWVGINASSARSPERFERILEYDQTHASYAYETLAIFYYTNHRLEKATEIMEIACDISANPRQLLRLAMFYDELGRKNEALDVVRSITRKHPDNDTARFYHVSLLEKQKLLDELLEVARDGTKYHPEKAIYWFYVGEVSAIKGDIEEGLSAYRKCLSLDPPPKARERCLKRIEEYGGGE